MVKIAINTEHKNKMPNHLHGHEMRNWWKKFNGDFKNYKLPVEILIKAIQDGYSYTAQHRRYRKSDNFIAGQHIGLDYDTGDRRSLLSSLCKNDFFRRNASFIHTTASHSDSQPRSRVVFILEKPIYNKKKYSLLTEAFAESFSTNGGADAACKDPVRLFFGAENCEVHRLNNILTFDAASEIVLPYKEKLQQRKKELQHSINANAISDGGFILNNLVNTILGAPDGEKWFTLGRVSRAAGGYVAGGYFSERLAFDTLLQAIASRPSTRDLNVAEERIRWGLHIGREDPLYLEEDLDPVLQGLFT